MNHTFFSPAKVNLLLKIISRRPDGYHNLFSIVDPISLYDVIKIEEITGDSIIVEDDAGVLPKGEGNTLFRAAKAVKDCYSVTKGVHISVEKHIPIGSGLGGPSSNAATVLKALIELWDIHPPETELTRIGAGIGADVPLFLSGKPCIMEGIGDIITPIELPFLWYLVVYPDYILSTKEAYSRLKIVLTNSQKHTKLMG
ncbi:MAG TPA: 4-(cytidine 5'-diphospho)-2-C-methyl-D-erythritol kinase, partial [Syntrophorhabdaceae bacterium]|nr:4-(cytidine 5'-diphospho)-2-C-methyl-D-erythritol kinase [Syntrophorhabdaceae bacterium]